MFKRCVLSVFLVSALAGLMLLLPQASRPVKASGWEWRQDDWTGGPGQPMWLDDARYSSSSYVDTTTVPGTLRLSYLANAYVKEAANPILDPGAPGEWDESGLSASVRPYEGGGYEAVYRGFNAANARAVGYASTGNGVNWSKFFDNPVLTGDGSGTWEEEGVGTGPLLKEGDANHMWFRGYDNTGYYHYGYATSPDLINWDRLPDFVFGPGPAGSWDEYINLVSVIHDGSEYKAFYQGASATTPTMVGLATSTDGVSWSRSAANPVLTPGAPGSWDETDLNSLYVLERPWAGDFMIAYSATDSLGNQGVGLALSPDGSAWTKFPGNPVLTQGPPGSYNENGLGVSSLSFDGSMYRLYLTGINAASKLQSGEAYSSNGTAWNLSPYSPFLAVGAPGSWDENMASAGRHYLEGGTLRCFYTGLGATIMAMGTATSAPSYYGGGASLTSSVFDAGSPADWGNVSWQQDTPAATSVTFEVRGGDVPVPDGSWTAWAAVANGGAVPHPDSRYLQYKVGLNGFGINTPTFSDLVIDFTALPSEWYFAEGYTGSGFDQWITVQNPGAAAADLEVMYYTPGSPPELRNHSIPGQSRMTIYVNEDLGPDLENSCRVTSTQPVIVERPMYFHYDGSGAYGWEGGHVTMGSTGLSRTWYFAEGYTGSGFDEYLTLQNPGNGEATVDVTYYVNGGVPIRKRHVVRSNSRYTIKVNDDAGEDLETSVKLVSDRPILAERPMYFDFAGHIDGGHIVMGSPQLSDVWYLAEGATFAPFTEFITIQNPQPDMATLNLTYFSNSGAPLVRNHTLPARSRYTINAGTDSGLSSDVSVRIVSDMPVLVERPMYFDMLGGGQPGGHCAMGVVSPSTDWYFAEGYTGPGFDEWLTLQNPFPADAPVVVVYYTESGAPLVRNHTVPGQTRYTINVGTDAGDDLELSLSVHSTGVPVIAERPMYFFYDGYHDYGWAGGHDTAGFAP